MSYLESFVPNSKQKQRQVVASWKGMDNRYRRDADTLTAAYNVSYEKYPEIRPAKASKLLFASLPDILSSDYVGKDKDGVEQLCEVIYVDSDHLRIRVLETDGTPVFDQTVNDSPAWGWKHGFKTTDKPMAIPFNVYSSTGYDIVSATYERNILIFPYGLRINIDATTPQVTVWNIDDPGQPDDNPCPTPSLVAVHQGRVWGAKDGKIFASEWNNFANWNPPTATDMEEGDVSHFPWVSATQSSIEASEDFTAIYSYDGHIVAFKKNFMHQIYNTKNPFRIVDVCRIGCNSQRCITECNKVLYFASGSDVYAYTGGYPEKISESVCDYYSEVWSVSSDERNVYVVKDGSFLVYDTVLGFWSARQGITEGLPRLMIKTQSECLKYNLAASSTNVYSLNNGDTYLPAILETSFFAKGEISEKRINKVRLLVNTGVGGGSVQISTTDKYDSQTAIYAGKLIKVFSTDENGTFVLTALTRITANYGFRIVIQFTNAAVSYLQIDYEKVGELNA